MTLHAITISVSSSADPAYVSDVLFELGALSVTVTDQNRHTHLEQPIYAEPPQTGVVSSQTPDLWKNATINSLFPLSYNIEALQMLIATHFHLKETPTFRIHTDLFDEKSPDAWVRHVQQSFQPMVIGRVRISFPWHDPDHSRLDIKLEPGMAFGTGEHPTTQLCISWLQHNVEPNTTVLDFGTGSGILAIASVLLQEGVNATGVDLDETALEVARENATANNVQDSIQFFTNSEERPGMYDFVVANILAGPLQHLAPTLVSRMKPGARIALSGILVSQAPDLIETYQKFGVTFEESIVQDAWTLLVGAKL